MSSIVRPKRGYRDIPPPPKKKDSYSNKLHLKVTLNVLFVPRRPYKWGSVKH